MYFTCGDWGAGVRVCLYSCTYLLVTSILRWQQWRPRGHGAQRAMHMRHATAPRSTATRLAPGEETVQGVLKTYG